MGPILNPHLKIAFFLYLLKLSLCDTNICLMIENVNVTEPSGFCHIYHSVIAAAATLTCTVGTLLDFISMRFYVLLQAPRTEASRRVGTLDYSLKWIFGQEKKKTTLPKGVKDKKYIRCAFSIIHPCSRSQTLVH